MNIRLSTNKDIPKLLEIYSISKKYMWENGNLTQWNNSYPSLTLIEEGIKKQEQFSIEINNEIYGTFAFIIGDDPTYLKIENGQWLNDHPYGTIHRIASNGKTSGVFENTFQFCKNQIDNIRIDTHQDNKKMQYLIKKNGFKECGIIRLENGDPRIAYHYYE